MAEKVPNAPATETLPQTESFSFDDQTFEPEEQEVQPSQDAVADDLDWLWDDDEEDEEDRFDYSDYNPKGPSEESFKSAFSLAKKAADPLSAKATVATNFSSRATEDLMKQVEEESGIVEVKRPLIVPREAGVGQSLRPSQSEVDSGAVSKDDESFLSDVSDYAVDKVIQFGGNVVLPALEQFDVPRSELWTAAYYAADKALPDSDTFYGSALSDIYSEYSVLSEKYSLMMNKRDVFQSEEQEEQYFKSVSDLSKNIYKAWADGKLYDAAKQRDGYFVERPEMFGLLTGGNASGFDYIDIAYPLDVMQRLNKNSPGFRGEGGLDKLARSTKEFGGPFVDPSGSLKGTSTVDLAKTLSDPTTRMMYGLALEVVADPLWFVGVAKNTIKASLNGVTYNLGQQSSRAVQVLDNISSSSGRSGMHAQTVLRAVVSTGEEANKARTVIREAADIAETQARYSSIQSLKFTRLADSVESTGDVGKAKQVLEKELADQVDELETIAAKYADPSGGQVVKKQYEVILKKVEEIKAEIAVLSGAGSDAKKVATSLRNLANKSNANSAVYRGAASDLRSFVNLAESSTHIKQVGITEKSLIPVFGTWHVPFKTQTATIGTKSQLQPVVKSLNKALQSNDVLASSITKTSELMQKFSADSVALKISQNLSRGVDALDGLSKGQQLVWSMYKAGDKAKTFTYAGADLLARILGTRYWQALTASKAISAEMQYYGSRQAMIMGLRNSDSSLVRMKRLRPDLWDNYQSSVTKYLRSVDGLAADATRRIDIIYRLAGGADGKGGALAEWKAATRDRDIPQLQAKIASLNSEIQNALKQPQNASNAQQLRALVKEQKKAQNDLINKQKILSDDYDVNALIDDVADLVETGAGKIDEIPWLKAVAEEWKKTRAFLASSLKIEEEAVNQSLLAMVRWGKGDKVAAEAITERILEIRQVLEGRLPLINQKNLSMDQIVDALNVQLGSTTRLLNSVSENKLAEVVYRTISVSEGRPFGQEVAQAIDDTLMEAFKGNRELVDEILDHAAGAYGANREEAILLFARDISGEYKAIKDAVDAGVSPAETWQRQMLNVADIQAQLIHPLRKADHPQISDIPENMSMLDFIATIQNRKVEFGALYDARNGAQVTVNRGTKDSVKITEHVDLNILDDLIQSGELVTIHNHPSGYGLARLREENKKLKIWTDKQLKFVEDQAGESLVFSFDDMLADLALNSKVAVVVQPNGTVWMVRRPPDGWKGGLGPDSGTYAERVKFIEDNIEMFSQKFFDLKQEIASEVSDIVKYYGEDFSTLKAALDDGIITTRQYKAIRKAKQKDSLNYVLAYARESYNEKAADIFESLFGARPFRTSVEANKYDVKPPIRRDPDTGNVIVERGYTGRRIREAIRFKKQETKAAIAEIKNYRLGLIGKEDLIYTRKVIEDFSNTYSSKLIDKSRQFASKHYNISAPDEVAEQADIILEDIFSWIRSDYPSSNFGLPVYKGGNRVSRTASEWIAEKKDVLDLPDSVTAQEVLDLFRDVIKSREASYHAQLRLNELGAGAKRLKGKRGDYSSSLSVAEIQKKANKIKSQRVDDVLNQVLKGVNSFDDAKIKIREAFDELLNVPDTPIFSKMKDEMAEKLAYQAYKRGYSLKPALKEAKNAGRKLLADELEELKVELAEKIPRMEIPDVKAGTTATEYLKDWELKVWDEFKELTENLTTEEGLLAAFAALADSPKVINQKTVGKDAYDFYKTRYKYLLGQRMGELPKELEPVKEAFTSLIKHYEQMYIKHGMTFVKSPVEMLRLWGVVDYVPHTPLPGLEVLNNGLTETFMIKGAKKDYNEALERSFGTGLEQRKRRLLQGTMREVNASANRDGVVMGTSPTTLLARYLSASKAISNQEFMYSLLVGGVLKPVKPKSPYDHALEVLAKKYNLGFDEAIESMSRAELSGLVTTSNKLLPEEMTLLDNLLTTADSGEMVNVAQRAIDLGYTPLFDNASKMLSNDLLVNGNAAQWAKANLLPNQMDDLIEEAAKYSRAEREDKFAKFVRDTPAIKKGDQIISVVGQIRANDYKNGQPLYDVMSRYQDVLNKELRDAASDLSKKGMDATSIASQLSKNKSSLQEKAWNTVAKELNQKASDLKILERVSGGESLRAFYNQQDQMWNLYVPDVVKQSFDDLFQPINKGGKVVKALRRFNDFWKLRVTIIAAAFHSRNHLSNKLSNLLDTGIASLNPKTGFDAGQLSALVHYRDRYGSIEAAKKILSAPQGRAEPLWRYNNRKAANSLLNQLAKPGKTFDLGDGIFRSADESLKILEENGVIAGSLQQFVDVNMYETQLARIYQSAGIEKNLDKAKRAASAIEDGVIMALPGLMTGMVLPIGLPKKVGSAIGRSVENQARLVNFITNNKQGLSFSQSAKKVEQFLFNYRDLTAAQKDWMRLFFPFFTWTQKNIALQLKMMQENPVFYSQFQRVLIHQGPEVVEAYNQEIAGEEYSPVRSSGKYQMAFRDDHARNFIRFPVPGKPGFYVEGLGLPQEALFDQFEMMSQLKDLKPTFQRLDNKNQGWRFLGQTHMLLKYVTESMLLKHNTFMDMPIRDMTSGRFIGQVLGAIRNLPLVGESTAGALEDITGYNANQYYSTKYNTFMSTPRVNGFANYNFSALPWSRVLKDAAAASMMFNTTYLDRMDESMREKYAESDALEPLSERLKVVDAITGIRIIADNKEARKARFDYDVEQRRQEAFRRAGITGTGKFEFLKEQ